MNSVVSMYKAGGFLSAIGYITGRFLLTLLTFPGNVKQWYAIRHIEDLAPPWITCPDIPRGSIGWRMGGGESVLMEWDKWYKTLAEDDRIQYQLNNPEPAEWEGFYESRK